MVFCIFLILLISLANSLRNEGYFESCSYNIEFNDTRGYSIGTDFIPSEASLCYKRVNYSNDHNNYKCCYEEYKKPSETEKNKRCVPLSKEEYNNLPQYISELKEVASFDVLNINCNEGKHLMLYFPIAIYLLILFLL